MNDFTRQSPIQMPLQSQSDPISTDSILSKRLLIATGIVLIGIMVGVIGYWTGISNSQSASESNRIEATKLRTPKSSPTLSQAARVRWFKMPLNGIAIEKCSYPWDFEPSIPSPARTECIEYEANGTIRKVFHDAISHASWVLTSNQNFTEEQRATIIVKLEAIYKEITDDEEVLMWLEKPKIPVVGSSMPYLKLHSAHLGQRYTVTGLYILGNEDSRTAKKVQGILEQLEQLHSISSLTENREQ